MVPRGMARCGSVRRGMDFLHPIHLRTGKVWLVRLWFVLDRLAQVRQAETVSDEAWQAALNRVVA